ncbi:unnamed protein product [Brassica oleracea]
MTRSHPVHPATVTIQHNHSTNGNKAEIQRTKHLRLHRKDDRNPYQQSPSPTLQTFSSENRRDTTREPPTEPKDRAFVIKRNHHFRITSYTRLPQNHHHKIRTPP